MKKLLASFSLALALVSTTTPVTASDMPKSEHVHASYSSDVGIPHTCGGTFTYRGIVGGDVRLYQCTGCGDTFTVPVY